MIKFVFDLQRFAKSGNGKTGFDALELMHNIIQRFDLKASGNSTLQFIGTFYGSLFFKKSSRESQTGALTTMLADTVSIVEDVYAIREENAKDNPSKEVITSKAGDFVSKLLSLTNAFKKLNGGKNSFILSVVSSAVGLASNLVLGMNGLEKGEVEKINKNYVALVKVSGAEIIKKFFSAGLADKFIDMPVSQILDNPTVKAEIRKQTAANFTKGSGPLGLIFAAITGILNGANKYDNNLKKYTDDGIPEDIAKHEAVIDALATFIHDTASNYAKGFDDTVFKWVQSAISYVTGKDIPYYTDKNYVEVVADQFKTLNYKNSGTSGDDSQETFIVSVKNKSYIYGDNGNDSIQNVASNATIWGGHDDDTIWSVNHESETPTRNSIFGGPGDDFIAVQDTQSTIYGGKGNDFLLTQGTKNIIYGDAGNDSIVIDASATDNSIYGGLDDDLIFIESGAKKNKFFYTSGDGNDTIYNFGASDSLTVSGKFSTVKSGSDINVKVGNGSILLVGAADKKIYINGNVLNDEPISSGTFTPIPYPTLPSAPESPLISGTSGDDEIFNSRSNVLISSGTGNDDIYNHDAEFVTIDSGTGNDTIENHQSENVSIVSGAGNDSIENIDYSNSVTIDSGAGNDSIYSWYSSNVTINGGDGEDTIEIARGINVSIDGGTGNDDIDNYDVQYVTIDSGAGDDTIINNYGHHSSISAGAGNDYYTDYYNNCNSDNVTINMGAGNDTISLNSCYAENNLIVYNSGDGNDIISGFNSDDTLKIGGGSGTYFSKRSGDDVIVTVGKGKITLQGAANLSLLNIDGVWKDPTLLTVTNSTKSPVTVDSAVKTVDASTNSKGTKITGNALNNSIVGGSGKDYLLGEAGDDTLAGSAGDDKLFGDSGNDSLNGDEGNDIVQGGKGLDTVYGGAGNDTVYGGDGNDLLNGFSGDDYLLGEAGDDTLAGSAGNDIISGGLGNDSLGGGNGNDTLSGEDGNDILLGGAGKDSLFGAAGNDILFGDEGNDILLGDAGDDSIDGGKGNDILSGGSGNDTLAGGYDNDTLSGRTGNDKLFGGSGNDSLNGGKGNDSLWGDAGADKFFYAKGDGKDIIFGFDNKDTLTLDNLDFTSSYKNEILTLKVIDGSITLKNFSATTFHINDDSYKISGSKLVKK